MKTLARIASVAALALTVVPAFLVLVGRFAWDTHALLMLAGTVLWFATAPLWMKRSES
jgi:hypothetical protein